VYDDGVVKGFLMARDGEVKKLFAEPVLQGCGIGAALLNYAIKTQNVKFLWALEKNTRAISFYLRHGFRVTSERKPEEGTSKYLIRMER
jgi:putative acetyltransferase